MRRVIIALVALIALLVLVTTVQAGGGYKGKKCKSPAAKQYSWCKPKPQPPVVVPTAPVATAPAYTGICANGRPAIAGTDGHVPASGNTNDNCDWSVPAQVPHPAYPND